MIPRRAKLKIKASRIDYAAIAVAKAYAIVEKRDDERSRVTNRDLFPIARSDKDRREHNHLGNRSTHPAEITDPANIFLVSTYEHGFITRNELVIHGTDARKKLTFSWNRASIKPGKEPFRIPTANRFKPGKAKAA